MATAQSAIQLQESKRQAVRSRLSAAALELLAERDFDEVTADEIATAAGVSRRTFFRYFTSKEEVVLGFLDHMARRLHDAIVERPPHEAPVTAVHVALRPRIAALSADADRTMALVRLMQRSPSLRARELESRQRMHELVAQAIGRRLGIDHRRDLRPRLLAGIALVPLDVALTAWLDTRPHEDVRAILDEAITALTPELSLSGS